MRAFLELNALESRWRRGLQHRRPEVRLLPGVPTPDHQSGHQLLDNCRGIVPGIASRWSREGSVASWRVVDRPTHARHVDVAERTRHRLTNPEVAGSTPAVDAHLAVAQRSRAPPSEGGGRTFESCRRGQRAQALVAQEESTSPVRTRSWVRLPPRAPHRDGREVKTPGPQPGSRGSSPRRGTHGRQRMPGGRAERRPAVTRKAGVRAPPWQRNARWPRIQARGCKPRDEGESPSRASIATRGRRPNGEDAGVPRRR